MPLVCDRLVVLDLHLVPIYLDQQFVVINLLVLLFVGVPHVLKLLGQSIVLECLLDDFLFKPFGIYLQL